MNNVVLIIILTLILIISRAIPIYIYRKTTNHDSYFYLLCAKKIRNKLLKKGNTKIMLDESYISPPLFPATLSLFPQKFIEKIFKLIPIFLEMLNFFIFLLFIWIIFGQKIPQIHLILISLIFIFNPLYTSLYPGPRTYKATPRLLSELLINIIFLCFFAFIKTGSVYFMLAAYLLGVIALFNSKFALQVLLFFVLPLGLLMKSWILATYPLFIILIALIISRKLYHNILKYHFILMICYCKKMQFSHPLILARKQNKLSVLKKEGIKRFLASVLLESDFFNFFIKNYLGLVVIFLLLTQSSVIPNFFIYWFGISIAIYLLTTTKYLRFLGEAERYLFFSGIAMFLIFTQYLLPKWIYLILIGFGIIYWLMMITAIYLIQKYDVKKLREKNEQEVINFIKEKKYENILPIEYSFPNKIMYYTDTTYCGFFKHFKEFYEDMRLPVKGLNKLRKKYKFNVILLNKKYKARYEKALQKWKKVLENEIYEIYEGA